MTSGLGTAVPWLPQGTPQYLSSFDTNIGTFVKEHGQSVHLPSLPDVSCWVITLHGEDSTLELHIYKERLGESTSAICDQCRIIGKTDELALQHLQTPHAQRATQLLAFCRLAESPCVKAQVPFHCACKQRSLCHCTHSRRVCSTANTRRYVLYALHRHLHISNTWRAGYNTFMHDQVL